MLNKLENFPLEKLYFLESTQFLDTKEKIFIKNNNSFKLNSYWLGMSKRRVNNDKLIYLFNGLRGYYDVRTRFIKNPQIMEIKPPLSKIVYYNRFLRKKYKYTDIIIYSLKKFGRPTITLTRVKGSGELYVFPYRLIDYLNKKRIDKIAIANYLHWKKNYSDSDLRYLKFKMWLNPKRRNRGYRRLHINTSFILGYDRPVLLLDVMKHAQYSMKRYTRLMKSIFSFEFFKKFKIKRLNKRRVLYKSPAMLRMFICYKFHKAMPKLRSYKGIAGIKTPRISVMQVSENKPKKCFDFRGNYFGYLDKKRQKYFESFWVYRSENSIKKFRRQYTKLWQKKPKIKLSKFKSNKLGIGIKASKLIAIKQKLIKLSQLKAIKLTKLIKVSKLAKLANAKFIKKANKVKTITSKVRVNNNSKNNNNSKANKIKRAKTNQVKSEIVVKAKTEKVNKLEFKKANKVKTITNKVEPEIANKEKREKLDKVKAEKLDKIKSEKAVKVKAEKLDKIKPEKAAKVKPEKLDKVKSEKAAKVKLEKFDKVKPEKLVKAKPEKLVKVKTEKVVKVKPEKVVKVKTEKVAKVKVDKVKTEKFAKVKPEKVVKAKAEKVDKAKAEKIVEVNVEKLNKLKNKKGEKTKPEKSAVKTKPEKISNILIDKLEPANKEKKSVSKLNLSEKANKEKLVKTKKTRINVDKKG